MKNKEKTEIVIPSGYSLDELLDLDSGIHRGKTFAGDSGRTDGRRSGVLFGKPLVE